MAQDPVQIRPIAPLATPVVQQEPAPEVYRPPTLEERIKSEQDSYNRDRDRTNTNTKQCTANFFKTFDNDVVDLIKATTAYKFNGKPLINIGKPTNEHPILNDDVYKPVASIISKLKSADYDTIAKCLKTSMPEIKEFCAIVKNQERPIADYTELIKKILTKYGKHLKDVNEIAQKIENAAGTMCESNYTVISPALTIIKSITSLADVCEKQVCPVPPPCEIPKTYKTELIAVSVTFGVVCIIMTLIILAMFFMR